MMLECSEASIFYFFKWCRYQYELRPEGECVASYLELLDRKLILSYLLGWTDLLKFLAAMSNSNYT
jgi:hypothetical protein